ncbi:Polyadenylate-binding protein RBP47 [Acorus gramineus]|uniref:Polyadenylate-binding protein RBP47 n=1 Tax=Acorus gramineus TaxID=55184 RepID=A0AAV9A110_ACOGR|nr:Polyadenylate-binding protein RBP47 [Acorus gramineus]
MKPALSITSGAGTYHLPQPSIMGNKIPLPLMKVENLMTFGVQLHWNNVRPKIMNRRWAQRAIVMRRKDQEVGVGDEEEFIEEEVGAVGSVGVVDDGEHHDFVRERYKRKEYEIFIGGLDRGTTEEELRKIFSEVGEIVEVRLMKNHITGVSKGFAFLRFATVDQAKRACAELKHPTIHGKQCGVAPSKDSDTLFIGHICKTWSKETLKEKLAEYGVDNFEELTLVEDTAIVGMNRGFAFLDFSSRSEAVIACKHLQRRNVVFGTDRNAKVAFADTFIEPDDEIMAQVKTVFVDGLPVSWDEDRVKQNFKKFGRIEKIELARNMPAAKRADFGFITFDTHDSAVTCAENMNNTDIDDGEKKVKIRARLSRPRQRGRLGKYSRGNYMTRDVSGQGSRSSQDRGMSQWGTRRFAERGQSGDRDRRTFSGGYKRPLGARDRYPVIDLDRDRKRRHLSPWERDVRRAPDSTYERGRLRRDLAQYEEPHSRISDLSSRFAAERRSSLRYRPGYLESPPHNATRDALHRLPVYEEESNGRRIDRHSYHDSHSHDYGSLPGSRRLVPAMDDFDSRYAEPTVIRSRARFDYGGSSGTIQYEDVAYRDEPARIRRGSHLGYDGDVRNSTGHSLGLYEPASSIGYSRGRDKHISRWALVLTLHYTLVVA